MTASSFSSYNTYLSISHSMQVFSKPLTNDIHDLLYKRQYYSYFVQDNYLLHGDA